MSMQPDAAPLRALYEMVYGLQLRVDALECGHRPGKWKRPSPGRDPGREMWADVLGALPASSEEALGRALGKTRSQVRGVLARLCNAGLAAKGRGVGLANKYQITAKGMRFLDDADGSD